MEQDNCPFVGSDASSGNTAKDWSDRVNELKTVALKTRLGIPLLYGIDAVHGNNNVYGTTIYPHNIGLGATGDTELTERIGRAVAEEVRAIGVQWTFAPTLGNPQNERWGRTYECFSEEPYAEMYGDRTPEILTISDKDRTLLNNLKDSLEAQGKEDIPKVAIITAGRPVNITEYMDMFDVVIMAWLPGTEGAGIADVLFGDYDFTGKLTYTWLKDPADMEKKFAENNEEYILFEKGYGLNKKGERLP